LGTGLGAFYHQIAMSYLNIPKTLTDEFLRQQGDYLVARVPRKLVNKPILTRVPNERWGVDLINMENYTSIQNHFRRYILTVVDYFSGKVFARALRNRNNNAVNPTLSNAINDICVNEAQTFPHTIQGDGEFTAGAFRAWCNANNIEFIKTTSYTPTSNGKVERMNREIRKKIKAGFIRQNNLVWNAVGQLQSYVENNTADEIPAGFVLDEDLSDDSDQEKENGDEEEDYDEEEGDDYERDSGRRSGGYDDDDY
jgi:hypothetical protein